MAAGGVKGRFDAAVVVPTTLRPSLARAVRSVFRQAGVGRIQLLIGVDRRDGPAEALAELERERPPHVAMSALDLGYSTAQRHGGLYPNAYGGALRTVLSYAADSRYVAYLDDDDWWAEDHLAGLLGAIAGKDWAFSGRWMVDAPTGWPICRDEWDSVGPGRGINQARFGGFCGPSTLMLDKLACHFVPPYWSLALGPDGGGEDRLVFKALSARPWGASGRHSCFYSLSPEAQGHAHHAREFAARGIGWVADRGLIARADALMAAGDLEAALEIVPHHPEALARLAAAPQP